MIKLVLTDMDDTLIPAGAKGASRHAIDGIHAMQEAGLRFGPVSGRQPEAMRWMFEGHPECYATGAFCNGQVMFVDGEVVGAYVLDNDALMRLAAFLEEETDDTFIKVYNLGDDLFGNNSFCVTDDAERVRRAMCSGSNAWLNELCDNHFGLNDEDYYKANIWSTKSNAGLAELRLRMLEVVPELDYVFPNNNVCIFDITPAGWNKGCAVRELARALELSMDEVAVFGDSENDMSMIEVVPNAVAMGNASDEVKAAARWHIGDTKDDAVADALFEIAKVAPEGTMPTFMRS